VEDRKLWTTSFVLAIVANFCTVLVFYLLMTVIALYAVDRFAVADGAAGMAAGVFVLGAVVGRIFAGKFMDFTGRRRMLLASLLVLVVAGVLYIPADQFGLLVAVRIIHGAAFGVASNTLTASAMAMIPAARRGEGTGYFAVSNTLAIAVGPLLATTVLDLASFEALFFTTSGAAAVALLVTLFLRLPERAPTADEQDHRWRMRWVDVLDSRALGIASVVLVAGVAYSGVLAFLNSYAQSLDLLGMASWFFLGYAVVVLLARLSIGRLQDRFGDNVVVYPTLFAFAVGLAVLAFFPSATGLLVASGFIGFGFGGLLPCVQAIAVTMVPMERVGIATSTYYLALDAGTGIGPLLLGLVVPLVGFEGMYGMLALVILGAMVLYHFVHGYKRFRR
jgi:MFS family permease